MIRVIRTGSTPALPDFVARRLEHLLVSRVLPKYESLNYVKQSLALEISKDCVECWLRARRRCRDAGGLGLRGQSGGFFPNLVLTLQLTLSLPPTLGVVAQKFHVLRGVVHHLRKNDSARCCERPTGPPEVQRARVPVPDRFLTGGRRVDCLER